ncbi:formamidopyrimidine-DNA glycosylase [soil metagenome]
MPEVLEVELTRRRLEPIIGARVVAVTRTDDLVVAPGVDAAIVESTITELDRRGKQLVLVTDGPVVGVHLGMTGRILLDGASTIGVLAYGGGNDHERWDRWSVDLDRDPDLGGGRTSMRLHDPRRLGRVTLDPDLDRLGPDVLTLRRPALVAILARRRAPLKAVLLDQHVIAGLGNMLVDEVLWWSSLDPHRSAESLSADKVAALYSAIRRRLPVMLRRGGSHTGVLSPDVRPGGTPCSRDGTLLARSVVGGRATVWCPSHQR